MPLVRPLDERALPDALRLWAVAHPAGPCAGDALPVPGEDTLVVEDSGSIVGIGALRTWGRTGHVHALHVDEAHRGKGLGAMLLAALVQELERRDASVVGIEVDAAGAGALTFLARAGFKPMQLSFVLEREAALPEDPAAAPALEVLSGSLGAEALDAVRGIAASVDADFDPTRWLSGRLRAGECEVALLPDASGSSQPAGYAVLVRAGESDAPPEALAVAMACIDAGPAHAGLKRLVDGLSVLARERGVSRLLVAAPSRYWDATRALLDMGFRPRASFLRLTLLGHPERADLRRVHLTTWR